MVARFYPGKTIPLNGGGACDDRSMSQAIQGKDSFDSSRDNPRQGAAENDGDVEART